MKEVTNAAQKAARATQYAFRSNIVRGGDGDGSLCFRLRDGVASEVFVFANVRDHRHRTAGGRGA